MGMRIPASSAAGAGQAAAVSNWQQRQQNFKSLVSAVQSGDLGGAQKAYASLASGARGASANSPLAQIGKALQSGDLAGAQQALQSLQDSREPHHAPARPPSSTSMLGTRINTTA
ncbi:MAG: hypothetical protein GC151_07880 [Betaproteobacteria bacterium]|nr:hypothetical protein [Betaproteobacteria bacterium]